MTREEAIKALEDYNEDRKFEIDKEPLDMAIKALKAEPCEDCISRQAAIDATCANCTDKYCSYRDGDMPEEYCEYVGRLKSLQSVKPENVTVNIKDISEANAGDVLGVSFNPSEWTVERPKGKWIMHIDDLFPAESTQECSKCHAHQTIKIDDNFCPNCGAEMEVDG